MTIEISLPNQEEIILKHLLTNQCASVYELQQLGVRYPSAVINKLVGKGIPIHCYNQETHEVEGHVIYSHYRYQLDKTGIWGGLVE